MWKPVISDVARLVFGVWLFWPRGSCQCPNRPAASWSLLFDVIAPRWILKWQFNELVSTNWARGLCQLHLLLSDWLVEKRWCYESWHEGIFLMDQSIALTLCWWDSATSTPQCSRQLYHPPIIFPTFAGALLANGKGRRTHLASKPWPL